MKIVGAMVACLLLAACIRDGVAEQVTVAVHGDGCVINLHVPPGTGRSFPGTCLTTGPWTIANWRDIDGFDYQEGYSYRLRVEPYHLRRDEDPPVAGPWHGYRLVEVISQKQHGGDLVLAQTIAPGDSGYIVTVGPELRNCVGVGPRTCMVVDGELFYETIDGFDYLEGYTYLLKIERYDAWPDGGGPPADASQYGYKLVELLSKAKAI